MKITRQKMKTRLDLVKICLLKYVVK